jgi:predicted NBD/HSP70 family sugar kinase
VSRPPGTVDDDATGAGRLREPPHLLAPRSPAVSRPDEIRRHNLALVLQHVHRDGPLSRAELTHRLALSRSTIGALVTDLCDLGLLEETVPVGGERAGRPSHVVAPHPKGPYAVAVDVDVDRVAVAAVTVGGGVLWRRVEVLGHRRPSTRVVARVIARAVEQLTRELCGAGRPFGIGVSVPGTVRPSGGVVEDAPNLAWHHESLGPLLAEFLPDLPVTLGNDADMGALAEHVRGAARGAGDVVYLTGKVGVGAGILVNGQPLRGTGGLAGEIGHTVIDRGGPLCHCGARGCVEGLIGEEALLRFSGRSGPPSPDTVSAVLADAAAGDAAARAGVVRVARGLGQVLANLVNLLNPQVIILGGSLAGVFSVGGAEVLAELDAQAMTAARQMVDVRLPALGGDSSLFGAAELTFQRLLADPLVAVAR